MAVPFAIAEAEKSDQRVGGAIRRRRKASALVNSPRLRPDPVRRRLMLQARPNFAISFRMMDRLHQAFALSPHDKAAVDQTVGRIKGVATFLSDAAESVKDADLITTIKEATPWWVEATGSAAAQSFPVVKFVASLFEKLTEEPDPQAVGLLACTLAYQQSVEEAITWAASPKEAKTDANEVKRRIAALDSSSSFDFTTFSLGNALQHPFLTHADELLDVFLHGVGTPNRNDAF